MGSFLVLFLTLEVLSLITLPFATWIFRSLSDKGFTFNKSLSLILSAFIFWFLASLHLISFSQTNLIVVLSLLGLLIYAFFRQSLTHIPLKQVIYSETIFLLIFLVTTVLKFYTPNIEGTEKPMDFALLNGIFRSHFFPPQDAWYAGASINYYYFGHYLLAFLAKLTNIPTSTVFTLALPLTFALTATNIYGLITNLFKNHRTAIVITILSIILVLFGANFDTPIQITKTLLSGKPVDILDWWAPSRVVGRDFLPHGDITITEFPYFSLLLGDVHAHVLALLPASLFLGIFLAFTIHPHVSPLILGSLLLSVIAMTNPWDLPFYTLLSLTAFLRIKPLSLFLSLSTLFLFLSPFLASFKMITPIDDPKPFISFISDVSLIGRHTTLGEFLTIWGTHMFIAFVAIISLCLFLRHHYHPRPQLILKKHFFPITLAITGFLILLFCEFFYINDFFPAPLERMNTIFKLYYQSWLLLGISLPILLGLSWPKLSTAVRKPILIILTLLLSGNLVYLITATPARLKQFPKDFHSLNGLHYLSSTNPEEYQAINWLNRKISDQPHLLESVVDPEGGNTYNRLGRISAATGLPTTLGWYAVNHEGGWRNSSPEIYERLEDANTIYQSEDIDTTRFLLQKYAIQYVYIGDLERQAYPEMDTKKFNQLGQVIYQNSLVTIYQVSR